MYHYDDPNKVLQDLRDDHYQVESDRRTHPRGLFDTDYECATCKVPWPCDTNWIINLLDAERRVHRATISVAADVINSS